jgi:hypothetical protein
MKSLMPLELAAYPVLISVCSIGAVALKLALLMPLIAKMAWVISPIFTVAAK